MICLTLAFDRVRYNRGMSSFFEKLEPLELSLTGKVWSASFSASVASAATATLQIKTGSIPCVVMDWLVGSTGQPLTIVAKENPTITDGTTAVVPYCTNRIESNTATTLLYSDPTGISGGTTIYTEAVSAEKGSGGSIGSGHSWVLKANEDYIWQITNSGNQTTTIAAILYFAEDIFR